MNKFMIPKQNWRAVYSLTTFFFVFDSQYLSQRSLNVFVSRKNSSDVDHRCDPVNSFGKVSLLNSYNRLDWRNSRSYESRVLRELENINNGTANERVAYDSRRDWPGKLSERSNDLPKSHSSDNLYLETHYFRK